MGIEGPKGDKEVIELTMVDRSNNTRTNEDTFMALSVSIVLVGLVSLPLPSIALPFEVDYGTRMSK